MSIGSGWPREGRGSKSAVLVWGWDLGKGNPNDKCTVVVLVRETIDLDICIDVYYIKDTY